MLSIVFKGRAIEPWTPCGRKHLRTDSRQDWVDVTWQECERQLGSSNVLILISAMGCFSHVLEVMVSVI